MTTSVALCCYNGERFIEDQLDSIISQSCPPDEIVLLDDCSRDRTADIAQRVLEAGGIRYRLIRNEENLGVKRSFVKCINACRGDVIFTSDQDDIWQRDKIKHMMVEYATDPDCVFVFSNGELVGAELEPLGNDVWSALNLRRAGLCDHVSQEKYRQLLMYYWAVPGTMMSFRSGFARKAFPIPAEGGWLHDSWLAITAPIYGNVAAIDKNLTLYRQHGKNTVGVKAVKRSGREEDITQIQKVLFYLKRHRDRLKTLVEAKGEEMPADYREEIGNYIKLFDELSFYEDSSNIRKALFLMQRMADGKLKAFDIGRGDIFRYLLHF
ncbi:MAG: glycosyltransferase [Lachnospiraceae bacterium]|nr:glycosyltransferase [Lachnospiraceae bacterium]